MKLKKDLISLSKSLLRGMEKSQIISILGKPSKETANDNGRVVLMFYGGIYNSKEAKDKVYNGNPFCIWVELINGKLNSHRLSFFPKKDPLIRSWESENKTET